MTFQITSLLSILVSAFFAFIHFEKNTKNTTVAPELNL